MLIQIAIFLLAAIIAVPLSRKLGLGAVLGYLGAGMIIGPWGLKLIDNVEAMLHISEFGVILLLFLSRKSSERGVPDLSTGAKADAEKSITDSQSG